jgi:NDP-sugar pyrophosphorylase family protein
MKAMILAAGLGTRMRPLTLLRAKAALPVLNRPLVQWTLEGLARHGVTDVMVNLHHLPDTVVRAVGDPERLGLKVSYSRERTILGTGGGPRKVRRFLGDEPCLLVNGDVAFDFDLGRLVRRHRASGAQVTLGLKTNPDPRGYGGVVTGAGGWVTAIAGLPRPRPGRPLLFTGVHVLDPALLERLPRGASDSVRDLYAPLLSEGGRILGVRLEGPWYDLGSPRRYLASHLSMLASGFGRRGRGSLVDPAARVHPRAKVSRAVVGAGCVVGARALVRESVLWDGVRVGTGAAVRRSVIAEGVRVRAGASLCDRVVMAGRDGRTLEREMGA